MVIPAGTLCLLLKPHSLAGQTCVVTGLPIYEPTLTNYVTGRRSPKVAYPISVGHSPVPDAEWFASPRVLVPITPPRQALARVRKPETVTA